MRTYSHRRAQSPLVHAPVRTMLAFSPHGARQGRELRIQDAMSTSPQRPPAPHEIPGASPHVRSHLEHGITVTEIHGITDLSTVTEIRDRIDAVTTHHSPQVIVDLRHVEFLDCSLLGLLCRAQRRTAERSGQLTLVCVQPWHLHVLEAARLGDIFQPAATVQDAVCRQRQET